MTYNVFGGMLNLALSIYLSIYVKAFKSYHTYIHTQTHMHIRCFNKNIHFCFLPYLLVKLSSGVARICCKEGQSWKLGHAALTVDFRAGCSSGSMTNSFVTNAVLIKTATSCTILG